MVRFRRLTSAAVCLGALCVSVPYPVDGKTHRGNNPAGTDRAAKDEIVVVGRLPLTSTAVTHFLEAKHNRRDYLYAESSGGSSVTLIDVTDPSRPAILSTLNSPSGNASVVSAAGTAALVSEGSANNAPASPNGQTFRIMSFADPQHPTVQQQFTNVSAFARDETRGLIFLADPQGVWILQEKPAMDADFERQWEHSALDNR